MLAPKILAFDFGLQRIGVAESFGSLAEPLRVVPHDEHVWTTITDLIQIHQPELFLVGVSEKTMAQLSQEFGQQLAQQFNLPVELYDETLSSVEVKRKLHERHQGKKQYKGPIDHYAAALILQNYLDETYD